MQKARSDFIFSIYKNPNFMPDEALVPKYLERKDITLLIIQQKLIPRIFKMSAPEIISLE